MTAHGKFNFKTKNDLLKKAEQLGIQLPFSEDISVLFDKVEIGKKMLPNRFLIHPMEGFDSEADGSPGELSFRRYRRYAAGGSGLIWVEATTVVADGRSNPGQFFIHKKNLDRFKKLVEQIRETGYKNFGPKHDLTLIIQLTHSGRFSRSDGKLKPVIARHHPRLDQLTKVDENFPIISDLQLDELQDAFVEAASLCDEAGFDGVDVKACHGYLVSELLAAFDREDSNYGSSFENRTRFLREVSTKIKSSFKDLMLACRLNVFDGLSQPGGFGDSPYQDFDLTEPKKLIHQLKKIGCSILSLSMGIPSQMSHFSRPFDIQVPGKKLPDEHPLVSTNRILNITAALQQDFPDLPMVCPGLSWLRHFFPNVGAGLVKAGKLSLAGQGRGAFAYPDFVKDLQENGMMNPKKVCIACSKCTHLMRFGGPTGCVVRDKEIYNKIYRDKIRSSTK